MMHATDIIKRPLISEKATWHSQERNRYTFLVDMRATKPEIAAAIAELYNVRVTAVATQVRKGRHFRTKYGTSKKSDFKRASVQLHEEDKIELF